MDRKKSRRSMKDKILISQKPEKTNNRKIEIFKGDNFKKI